jgi:hypothetical protein
VASQEDINNQKKFNDEAKESLNTFGDLRDILESINGELGKKINRLADARKSYTTLGSIAQTLQNQEENLVRLTDRQLDKLASKAAIEQKAIETAAEKFQIENKSLLLDKNGVELNKSQLNLRLSKLVTDGKIKEEGKALLLAQSEGFEIEKDTVGLIQQQVAKRKEANKAMGVAGALLKGLNALSPELAKGLKLDEITKDMQEFADKAAESGGKVSRLKTLGVGLKSAYLNLGDTLTDPSVILSNMVIGFNKVDKAATSFQQMTGENMNTLSTSLAQFNGGLVTSAELIEAAGEVTKEFGINANAAFTIEEISEIASMTKEMGLAGKEAANLARLSKVNGSNIEDQNKAIIEGVNSGNKQNRTAVATGVVLRDIASASEGIAISYAGYPTKLAEAATAARALGMTLSDTDKIASSLLQFESSIAAEMEAELLTGKSLNLERARELALSNNLAGLAKELGSQGITTASFSKMNRIQQEAQAKALGMSRDEMAKMLMQQGLSLGMSEKGLSDAQKVALEDMKRVNAQERIATAVAKLQQALAPIVEIFANIVTNGYIIYSVMGVALLAKMPMLVASAKSLAGGFAAAWKNAKGLVSGIAQAVTGKGTEKLKGALMPKGTDKVNELSNKSKPGAGKGLKENLQGLADGLRSMGTGPVAKGALNLGLFGIAAIPSLASIPFLLFMGLTPLTMLETNMQFLAASLRSMGTGSVLKGIGNFSLLALASILMIPGSVGLLMFGGAAYVAAAGITVLTPALIALGTAMGTGVGALGLVALVGTAVGLGVAFALVGVGALAMGKGIQLAAQGFGMMVPHILSLVPAIPSLFLLGAALVSIGVGLASIATAGTLAIPALIALGAVGMVAGSLFGGGSESSESSEKSSMAGVEAKLDQLISIVSAGGDVYLDGSKVGKTLQLSTFKMG